MHRCCRPADECSTCHAFVLVGEWRVLAVQYLLNFSPQVVIVQHSRSKQPTAVHHYPTMWLKAHTIRTCHENHLNNQHPLQACFVYPPKHLKTSTTQTQTSCSRINTRPIRCQSVMGDPSSTTLPDGTTSTPAQVQQRITELTALVKTADQLAPYDKKDFNIALLLWSQIAALPPAARGHLLETLGPRCVGGVCGCCYYCCNG